MRGRKRNGFVHLGNEDEPESSRKTTGSKIKKSSKQQPERKAKSAKKNEDREFRRQIEQDGTMSVNEMTGDGNCLFRSLSDQLYYDYGNKHKQTRQDICDYIEFMEEEFCVFLVLDENETDEDAANFEEYVRTMRSDGEWGGNLELVAAARLYGRNIKVFSMAAAYTIDHGNEISGGPDLMVR
jgi:OTU domain-containing protein 3